RSAEAGGGSLTCAGATSGACASAARNAAADEKRAAAALVGEQVHDPGRARLSAVLTAEGERNRRRERLVGANDVQRQAVLSRFLRALSHARGCGGSNFASPGRFEGQ